MALDEDLWAEAAKEALATASSEAYFIHTLEFSSPDIVDEFGNLMALRIVHGEDSLSAAVERDATFDPGDYVDFVAVPFSFALPSTRADEVPSIQITIDAVSRTVVEGIDKTRESFQPVVVTYRPYLSNDLSKPQMSPPLVMSMVGVSIKADSITGTATFDDIVNKKFPSIKYSADNYPYLFNQSKDTVT